MKTNQPTASSTPSPVPANLGEFLARLRARRGQTMRDIAAVTRGRISLHVVWKAEHGRPIKASTLALILEGLRVREGSGDYIRAFAIWSSDQAAGARQPDIESSLATMRLGGEPKFAAFARALLSRLKTMPAEDRAAVMQAAKVPSALRLWLASRKGD